jgi:predicted DsbA family dithiol-disulfide isomerase
LSDRKLTEVVAVMTHPDNGKTDSRPLITAYSDYICPFCFISSFSVRKLQKEFDITVDWKMIIIHPDIPPGGLSRRELEEEDEGASTRTWSNIERLAKNAGVTIRRPPFIASSRLATIATEYARQERKFDNFHEAVYLAYFHDGKNIGIMDDLVGVAEKIGLDGTDLKAFTRSKSWEPELERNRRCALRDNISGVPTFIIGRTVLVGVQSLDNLRHAFIEEFGRV